MKRTLSTGLISSVALMAAIACAPPAAQESAEIVAGTEAWIEAFNARDMDTLMGLYTDDARVLPPNGPIGQGSERVAAEFQAMFDAGLSGTLETVEAMAAGDLGHHVGTYTLSVGESEVDRGKFIELWQRVDGDWKITADMFSSDLPVPGSEGATLVAVHEVEDAEHWLAAWRGEDSRKKLFAEHGAPSVRVFQSQADANVTGLVIQVEDMDALTAMLESEEGARSKKEDGVKNETLQILTEVE